MTTEPLRAATISVTVCDHGTLTLHLHDESDAVFATAAMPVAIGADLIDDMMEQIEEYAKRALASCSGSA